MMMLNDKPTTIQTAYHLASAVIIAADERDYWNDIAGRCGRDWADDMQYKCSKRIKYAVEQARKLGIYTDLLKITETLLMANDYV